MPKEWERFRIRQSDSKAVKLDVVRHVAHVPHARRIVEEGRIKAGLVYDKSKLNTTRLSVAWVSANTWARGSIYGMVEFQFAWTDLIESYPYIYWVEHIPDYTPPAYRFLLSASRQQSELMVCYDPERDDGPLRLWNDSWYWNCKECSEFMITDDLRLSRTTGLAFVKHHDEYCRTYKSACEDLREQPLPEKTGGRMLSYILGHELHTLNHHFNRDEQFNLLTRSYVGLHDELTQTDFGGALRHDKSCDTVVRGALALYGMDKVAHARNLLGLISSQEHFEEALTEIIREHFGDPKWRPGG